MSCYSFLQRSCRTSIKTFPHASGHVEVESVLQKRSRSMWKVKLKSELISSLLHFCKSVHVTGINKTTNAFTSWPAMLC